MYKNKLIQRKDYNIQKAIILTAHAKSIEEDSPDEALNFALEANKLNKKQIIATQVSAKIFSESIPHDLDKTNIFFGSPVIP